MKKSTTTLLKITKLLSDQQFHDGTSIGEKLNITRAAVWKAMKKLEAYQIPLESIKGKGYALSEPLILLDAKQIKSDATRIEIFEEIHSTNDYLREQKYTDNKSYVCVAETQTKGKSRLQRSWHSPFGKNIYFSLRYPFYKDISELSGLSLVMGLAACTAIETVCELPEPLLIKWPNDILYQGKKLGGILIELSAETHGFRNLIIGVGINVNMQQATSHDIPQDWTSLKIITTEFQNRNDLCAALIKQLLAYLKAFEQSGLNHFIKEWKKRDYLFDKSLKLKSNQLEVKGIAMGINPQGQLLLKLADGSQQAFSSGDTTVAK